MYHPACVKREYKPLCAYVGRLWGIQCVCVRVCLRKACIQLCLVQRCVEAKHT